MWRRRVLLEPSLSLQREHDSVVAFPEPGGEKERIHPLTTETLAQVIIQLLLLFV